MSAALFSGLPAVIVSDAEFEEMARCGALVRAGRVELRRGMITPMSPVYMPHANLMNRLSRALQLGEAQAGFEFQVWSELSIGFGGGFQPTADIVVFDPRLITDDSGPLPGAAAALVVEVVDASLSDDLGEKLLEYARAGLAEYWVADVKNAILLRHAEPGERGYRVRAPAALKGRVESLTLKLAADLG